MTYWAVIWDAIWWFLTIFVFIAYLMMLFSIVADLFRDRELHGGWKALWVIAFIFIPVIPAIVYLIARGRGMAERNAAQAKAAQAATEDYVRGLAGTGGPASEIARAKDLLDAGAIDQAEYEQLKRTVLAS